MKQENKSNERGNRRSAQQRGITDANTSKKNRDRQENQTPNNRNSDPKRFKTDSAEQRDQLK